MSFAIEGLIYLLAGSAIIAIYMQQKKRFILLNREAVPELENGIFEELKSSLRVSYQRTLYLGIAFLILSVTTLSNELVDVKAAGIIIAIALFIANIPPRNRAMKILLSSGLDPKELKRRKIKL